MIDRATDRIERRTGRKLKARNYNGSSTAFTTTNITSEDYLFFDGDEQVVNDKGCGEYFLPQFPVQRSSVTGALAFELAYLSDRGSSGDTFTALVENEDYIVDYENGIIRLLAGRFTSGIKNYRAKCTAGYLVGAAQPYVPDALEQLCIDLIRTVRSDSVGVTSERIGSWSRSFDATMAHKDFEDDLAQFIRLKL